VARFLQEHDHNHERDGQRGWMSQNADRIGSMETGNKTATVCRSTGKCQPVKYMIASGRLRHGQELQGFALGRAPGHHTTGGARLCRTGEAGLIVCRPGSDRLCRAIIRRGAKIRASVVGESGCPADGRRALEPGCEQVLQLVLERHRTHSESPEHEKESNEPRTCHSS